jgi:hypothetical protein
MLAHLTSKLSYGIYYIQPSTKDDPLELYLKKQITLPYLFYKSRLFYQRDFIYLTPHQTLFPWWNETKFFANQTLPAWLAAGRSGFRLAARVCLKTRPQMNSQAASLFQRLIRQWATAPGCIVYEGKYLVYLMSVFMVASLVATLRL